MPCGEALTIEILPTDLKAVIPRKKGFLGLNTGVLGCTFPWSSLQNIGLAKNGSKANYTGKVEILVSRGGIRDRNISSYYSGVFKNEVLPCIINFKPECGKTFNLILHYSEDLLLRCQLVYKKAT